MIRRLNNDQLDWNHWDKENLTYIYDTLLLKVSLRGIIECIVNYLSFGNDNEIIKQLNDTVSRLMNGSNNSSSFLGQSFQSETHWQSLERIETTGRFVQKQNFRIWNQLYSNIYSFLLSSWNSSLTVIPNNCILSFGQPL